MRKNNPYFSVVIPLYNREGLIGRAIRSCLNQDFDDFEVIVVDDASTDGSVAAVKAFDDPRVKLLCHRTNRSQSPARNTGTEAARGEWVIYLDSDDELVPGALATIYQRSREVGDDIGILRFMCRLDSGELSPDPPLRDGTWDYESYIRFEDTEGRHDAFMVVRRSTFPKVRWPNNRASTLSYNLDLAENFITKTCTDVVIFNHQDAENQMTKPDIRRTLLFAPELAQGLEDVLACHGEALLRWAPGMYWRQVSGLGTLYFLSRNRANGVRCILRCLRRQPLSLRTWTILVLGLLGPKPLAYLKTTRHHWRMSKNF